MMSPPHLTVRGFKSIASLENFELRPLNVLIGANGAGKSNFLDLLRMLTAVMHGNLQLYVAQQGGPDAMLHRGRKHTERIDVEYALGDAIYRLSLAPFGERLIFTQESIGPLTDENWLGSGHSESNLETVGRGDENVFVGFLLKALSSWRVYHFDDTSADSAIRQAQPLRDNLILKPNGGNLGPYLRHLHERHPPQVARIVETVRMVAPFFGDFVYREDPGERVGLEWHVAGDPDTVWGQSQLSDGTLRFICLATLLLQPQQLQPQMILIDEPELGLHPAALSILAALLQRASEAHPVVVSTQSVDLVNEFQPEDVVVVERRDGTSTFNRLDSDGLADWLKDHSLGELWMMNVFGGRPRRD